MCVIWKNKTVRCSLLWNCIRRQCAVFRALGLCVSCLIDCASFSNPKCPNAPPPKGRLACEMALWWKELCRIKLKKAGQCGLTKEERECFSFSLWALGRISSLSRDQWKPVEGFERQQDAMGHFEGFSEQLAAVGRKDWKKQAWAQETSYSIPDERQWWDRLLTVLLLKKKKKSPVLLSLLPHKRAAACMASARNKVCSCLSAQEPAPDKKRTVNVRIGQFAKTLNPQAQS